VAAAGEGRFRAGERTRSRGNQVQGDPFRQQRATVAEGEGVTGAMGHEADIGARLADVGLEAERQPLKGGLRARPRERARAQDEKGTNHATPLPRV
jgi:hypothetical protein